MTSRSTVHGFPRIGDRRELKTATEGYWAGRVPAEELEATARELRRQTWTFLRDAGVGQIPSNHFSLYDQVLDTCVLVGAVPERHRAAADVDLDTYFAMARGRRRRHRHGDDQVVRHQLPLPGPRARAGHRVRPGGRAQAPGRAGRGARAGHHHPAGPARPGHLPAAGQARRRRRRPPSTASACSTRCWRCTPSCWTSWRPPGPSGCSSTSRPSSRTGRRRSWTPSAAPTTASAAAHGPAQAAGLQLLRPPGRRPRGARRRPRRRDRP